MPSCKYALQEYVWLVSAPPSLLPRGTRCKASWVLVGLSLSWRRWLFFLGLIFFFAKKIPLVLEMFFANDFCWFFVDLHIAFFLGLLRETPSTPKSLRCGHSSHTPQFQEVSRDYETHEQHTTKSPR